MPLSFLVFFGGGSFRVFPRFGFGVSGLPSASQGWWEHAKRIDYELGSLKFRNCLPKGEKGECRSKELGHSAWVIRGGKKITIGTFHTKTMYFL